MADQELRTLVVIPVYNHGESLRKVTQQALACDYPVLVVDDGSDDDGLQSVVDLDCETIRLPENQGKGAAILAGARYGLENNYLAIVTFDADGQHNPQEARFLVEKASMSDWPVMVIGAREMVQDTVPGSSHFGKKFSNFWVRLECGAELEDTQSGMRLYPVKELLQLQLGRKRYDFEVEVIVKTVWAGITVVSVPISVHYPPAEERISHFNKFLDNFRLTLLHSILVGRRLLPVPHKRLVGEGTLFTKESIKVGNPFKTLNRIIRENSSPLWLAVAVWFGIFLGALPLLACHTLIIIYVAHRLHFNKVAAVAASQFCMPPVVPALCIELGYFMRKGEFILDLSYQRWLLEIHLRVIDWFLGSLVLGPVLGFIGAFLTYRTAHQLQLMLPKRSR